MAAELQMLVAASTARLIRRLSHQSNNKIARISAAAAILSLPLLSEAEEAKALKHILSAVEEAHRTNSTLRDLFCPFESIALPDAISQILEFSCEPDVLISFDSDFRQVKLSYAEYLCISELIFALLDLAPREPLELKVSQNGEKVCLRSNRSCTLPLKRIEHSIFSLGQPEKLNFRHFSNALGLNFENQEENEIYVAGLVKA